VSPWAASALVLALGACARNEASAPEPVALDCAQSFDAQVARVTAQPGLVPAPHESAEPYRFYSSPDGRASWLITEPGAPGHPAIMMQRAGGGQVVTTGCPYGDKAGYDQLHAYLDSLKTWRRSQ
jgi:hypothetical protein